MPSLRLAALDTLVVLLAACASGGRQSPRGPAPAPECVVDGGGAADSTAVVRVAVTTPLDTTRAPWPRNAGERLLFAQLYEPLVRLDCVDTVVPGIARSWSRDGDPTSRDSDAARRDSGSTRRDATSTPAMTRWNFHLGSDARFASGDRVRATDVISSWRASAGAHSREPTGSLIAAVAAGARAIDDSTLVVTLPDSLADLRIFASPELTVARQRAPGSGWPDGTTSYDMLSAAGRSSTAESRAPQQSARRAVTAEIRLRARGSGTPLLFQVEPGADGRDILDARADLLITSSPAAIQYARTQASHAAIPLPWTHSYLLVLPTREGDDIEAGTGARGGAAAGTGCDAADLRPLRDALALAVHAEARGAEGPCWWTTGAQASPPTRQRSGSRQILYPSDDATARELAERLVALAAPGRDEAAADALHRAAPRLFEAGGWRASGADSVRFAESLAHASDGAYILALPRDPAWPAAARASLLTAAPWLAPLGSAHDLLPLVDTRETLLIRRERGIPRMTILHDGIVIFDAPAKVGAASAP